MADISLLKGGGANMKGGGDGMNGGGIKGGMDSGENGAVEPGVADGTPEQCDTMSHLHHRSSVNL